MVDDLDGYAAGFGFGEGAGGVAVEGFPGFGVDFGLEGGFQGLVGVVGAEEVGLADEEAFAVVVGVDEPAGDAVGAVGEDFAGLWLEDVDAVDLDPDLSVVGVEHVDVGFAEDHEQVALAGVLEVLGHVQVGVHARLEYGDAAQLGEFAGVGVVVDGAGNQHVETGVGGFARGIDQVRADHGAELGADEDGCALYLSTLTLPSPASRRRGRKVATFGADQLAGPGLQGGEVDLVVLARLLHAGTAQLVEDDAGEVAYGHAVFT